MNKEKAIDLAACHWEWVNKMLKATCESNKNIKMIGVYYRAAFIHGYKHGKEASKKEDIKNEK